MPKLGPLVISIRDPTTMNCYEEHKVNKTEARAECYIESTAESEFGICFALDNDWRKTWPSFLAKIYLDGKLCRRPIIGTCDEVSNQFEEIGGCHTSNGFLPFQFAARQFLERGCRDKEAVSVLGTIVVKVVRIENIRRNGGLMSPPIPELENEVDEKAKKSLCTLSVKLGKPVQRPPPTYWNSDQLDPDNQPFYTFIFHYRTRQILEATGIIASTASQEFHEESDTDLEDNSPTSTIRRLKNEIHALKQKVKREPTETIDLTVPPVKKQRIVVDLTD